MVHEVLSNVGCCDTDVMAPLMHFRSYRPRGGDA